MKGKKTKTTKKGTNRKLLYGVTLVTVILLATVVVYYVFFYPSSTDQTATLIDQLAVEPTLINQSKTFNTTTTSILDSSGFDVKYYGENITVDFYRDLSSKGSRIMILRVHSARRTDTNNIDLFTSEKYSDAKAYEKYSDLVVNGHISRAVFDVSQEYYFAIGPTFVTSIMRGGFPASLIVLMGCDSLNQTTMAEALVSRGAKVVVGWTKKVDLVETDTSTVQLLRDLLENSLDVRTAIEKVNQNCEHPFGATMDYYPKDKGNYIIETRKNGGTLGLGFQFMSTNTATEWKWKGYALWCAAKTAYFSARVSIVS